MKNILIKISLPLLIFFATDLNAQISPGDLTKAHAEFEGISNCTKCHDIGNKVSDKKCLDCHEEIKVRIAENKGYHASAEVKGKDCSKCHGEHFGRDFEIVRFDKKKFDHALSGFKLEGKHASLKCEECHKSEFIARDKSLLSKRKNTFLGLETTCSSCHEDYHKGEFKARQCTDCHGLEAWKPAAKFDHSETKFKLEGKHQNVDCQKCHKSAYGTENKTPRFTGVKFESCADCHKDVHAGKFGKNCESCHTTESFSVIINLNKFNHDKTGYPLLGKHRDVKCAQCHKTGYKQKVAHKNCYDCHSDYHKGEFIKEGIQTDCAVCHTEKGFERSLYSVEKHDSTRFALTGAHLAVACNECHFSNNEWKFVKNTECESCHKNVHGSEIEFFGKDKIKCEVCHNTEIWSDVKFDHSTTEFTLLGKHAETKCSECHFTKDHKDAVFINVKTDCASCHEDYHSGQFVAKYNNDCSACHGFENWKAEKFDHSETKFKLDGAHKNVSCDKCHKKETVNGKTTIKYKMETIACSACHS